MVSVGYVFTASTTLLINVREETFSSYYTCKHRFDRLKGGVLFLFANKILNVLKHVFLCRKAVLLVGA